MKSNAQRRVVTADDERVARRFLADVLATMPEVAVVGEAENGRDLVALIERERPDFAIVDAHLPDLSVLASLRAGPTKPRIVYLTPFETGQWPIEGEHVFTPASADDLRGAFERCDRFEAVANSRPASIDMPRAAAPAARSARALAIAAVMAVASAAVVWTFLGYVGVTLGPTAQVRAMAGGYERISFGNLADFDIASVRLGNDGIPAVPPGVRRLHGRRIVIRGFVIPLVADGEGISEFVLNGDYDRCAYGAPAAPNRWMRVRLPEGQHIPLVHTSITVFGRLSIGQREYMGSLYHVDADDVDVRRE